MDTSSRSGGPEPPTPLLVTLSTGIIKEIPRQPHSGSQTGLSGGGKEEEEEEEEKGGKVVHCRKYEDRSECGVLLG